MIEIEKVKDATTTAEMRAEINRLRWHDPLVKSVMQAADFSGIAAEDKYTILAYYALRERAQLKEAWIDFNSTHMAQPTIFVPGSVLAEGGE